MLRAPIHVIVILAAAVGASAQVELFSNGSAARGTPALGASLWTTGGIPAPPRYLWSEAPARGAAEANAVAGFSTHAADLSGAYRFADDFTITDPAGWSIHSFSFFAYQPGASSEIPPFVALTLRIWSGPPDDPASTIVFGNARTNRLTAATNTRIYRVFNTVTPPLPPLPDTTRLIWRADARADNVHLGPGTYWVDWQFKSRDLSKAIFAPPVSHPGSRAPAGANALQFKITGGTTPSAWVRLIDPGKPGAAPDIPQDLPFLIRGYGGLPCHADFNRDGRADSQDFFAFLMAFFTDDPTADLNDDGLINSQDFFDFLAVFFGGC